MEATSEDSRAFLSEPDFADDDIVAIGKKMDALVVSEAPDVTTFGGSVAIAAHMNARPPLKSFAALEKARRSATVLFTAHAHERLHAAESAASGETYTGLSDVLTAKGRARERAKALEIKAVKAETKAAQKKREHERKQKKNADASYSALNGGGGDDDDDAVDALVDLNDRVVAKQDGGGAYGMAMGDYYTAAAGLETTAADPVTYGGFVSFIKKKLKGKKNKNKGGDKYDAAAAPLAHDPVMLADPTAYAAVEKMVEEMGEVYAASALAKSPETYGSLLRAYDPATFDGIMDMLTAKGRARRNERKREVAAKVSETKARHAREEYERKVKKNEARNYTAMNLPALQPYGTHRSREEQLRMKAIADQTKPKKKTYASLSSAEHRLATFAARVIRHAPGQSLASVESEFNAANKDAGERHYFGSLALGAAVAKLRASVEAASGFSGAKLKKLTDDIRAQATVPADADESVLFAQALGDYAADVRTRAQQFSAVPKQQEKEAVRIGERFADVLMKQSAIADEQAFDTNHPSVVATAVADRLFQATYHTAMRQHDFATEHMNAFWAATLMPKTWRKTVRDHFA